MYEVVLVILHRPFVSQGHLYTETDHTIAAKSWSVCVHAANSIVNLLRVYDRDFSIRRAPYLIAYATYVAATIHVRVAAQMSQHSSAHSMLATCLNVFEQNRETNWAVKRAETVISHLMNSMNVTLDQNTKVGSQNQSHDLTTSPVIPQRQRNDIAILEPQNDAAIDIDMVIQSFYKDRSNGTVPVQNLSTSENSNHGRTQNTNLQHDLDQQMMQLDYSGMLLEYSMNDPLFGFYGSPGDNQWLFEFDANQNNLNI